MPRESEPIGPRAERLYQYIRRYLMNNAKPPSHAEMAAECGISRETVQKCIDHLKATGRDITQVKRRWRQVWVPIRDMNEEA